MTGTDKNSCQGHNISARMSNKGNLRYRLSHGASCCLSVASATLVTEKMRKELVGQVGRINIAKLY
jgi:hypothetical protein